MAAPPAGSLAGLWEDRGQAYAANQTTRMLSLAAVTGQ